MITPRRFSFVALVVMALLSLAACSESESAAVTVNGDEVDQQAVDDELDALLQYAEDHPDFPFGQQVLADGTGAEGDATVSSAFTAQVLTERVIGLVVDQEFRERDLELSDEDRQAAEEQFVQQLGQGDNAVGQEAFDKFPQEFQDFEVRLNAQISVLSEELAGGGDVTDEEVRAFYDDNPEQFEQNCVSHILVADEATANTLRDQITGGADFASVAEQNSTDEASAANGGDLGCQAPGTYVPAFEEAVADAEIDQVTEPVETEFGFHLILVTDRNELSFQEAEPQIRAQLQQGQQDPITPLLQELLGDADIEVNPRYGSWDEDAQQVIPPEGPVTTTTTAAPGAVPQGTVPLETIPASPSTTAAP